MVYEGQVRNGVVVFASAAPPEGTMVRIEPVLPADAAVPAAGPSPEQADAFWARMMSFAGRATGLPSDLAERHDHYRRERQQR